MNPLQRRMAAIVPLALLVTIVVIAALWWAPSDDFREIAASAGPSQPAPGATDAAAGPALQATTALQQRGVIKAPQYYHGQVEAQLAAARAALDRGLPPPPPHAGDQAIAHPLRVGADGHLVLDSQLMRHFRFFRELVSNEEPVTTALGRLLSQLDALPEPARGEARAALVSYLNVEGAKQELHRARSAELEQHQQAWQGDLRPDDAAGYQALAHRIYDFQRETLSQDAYITSVYGGRVGEALYAEEARQNALQNEQALLSTDPSLDTTTRIEKTMALFDLQPGMDVNNGNVFAAYLALDAAVIKNIPALNSSQRRALRERYLGPAMAERLERIYGP